MPKEERCAITTVRFHWGL